MTQIVSVTTGDVTVTKSREHINPRCTDAPQRKKYTVNNTCYVQKNENKENIKSNEKLKEVRKISRDDNVKGELKPVVAGQRPPCS